MKSDEESMEEQAQKRLIRNSLISLWRQLIIVDDDEDEAKMEKEEDEFMELWGDVWEKLRIIKKKNPQRWGRMRKKRAQICDKACENERNFQKAVDMADGFPPPKSEEHFKFLETWLFI